MCGLLVVFWRSFWRESLSLKGESELDFPNVLMNARYKNWCSYVDQLNQILHYLGTPSEDTLRHVAAPRVGRLSRNIAVFLLCCSVLLEPPLKAQDYIRSLPIRPRVPFTQMFPLANPLALDLLAKMLNFDTAKRITCEQALEHPYLAVWHDPTDEPGCPTVR